MRLRSLLVGMLFLVAACGREPTPATATLTPGLIGSFRANGGDVLTFSSNGSVLGTAGRGTFVLDGNRVTLSIGSQVVSGERSGADAIVFHPVARSAVTFYRSGSAAAQSAQASAPSTPAQAKPMPDRNVPLDHYAPLGGRIDARTLVLAFAETTPTDAQLAALAPETARTGDAFARQDAMAQHRSEINARLDGARQQRYYRTRLDAMPSGQRRTSRDDAFAWDWTGVQLGSYDFNTRSFPMPCFQTASIHNEAAPGDTAFDAVHFDADANARCSLPVPDEATARTVESARSHAPSSTLLAHIDLFFFVSATRSGYPNVVEATLTHVDLTLLDPTDASGTRELAHLSFEP